MSFNEIGRKERRACEHYVRRMPTKGTMGQNNEGWEEIRQPSEFISDFLKVYPSI